MIRSMTGYGEATRQTGEHRMAVEIRTVNHRFFNPNLRTPSGFDRYEQKIQGWLRSFVSRGHVKYTLTLAEGDGSDQPLPELDLRRAQRYRDLLEELGRKLGLPGEVDLAAVARFGDLFRPPDAATRRVEVDEEVLREVTEEAGRALVAMREAEGRRLQADLERALDTIAEALERIGQRAPERLVAERDRLRQAVRELAGQEDVDEERLAREIAYLAEKWDINEELVRFRSHVELFREALGAAPEEPVGKRLGFLVQEMHREANTIGAKASDEAITHAILTVKEEIERLREQLENVE